MTRARLGDATQTEREITGAKPAARLGSLIGGDAANQPESVEMGCSHLDADQVADESRNPAALRSVRKTSVGKKSRETK
jgi:hypothetical protein